ncbi:MAG: response regulator [Verrucomicrobia bacterium]|nr:response regulator [Verrucomicrobiota bacterium]
MSTTTTHSSPPPAILVVEDDLAVRETTTDLLSLTGAEVHAASSGREAFALLTRAAPPRIDLVITDLSMPDGDGHWLLAQIRGSPSISHLKVLIMSAHAQTENIEAGHKAGADGYLVKPYAPARFLEIVEQHLANAAAARGVHTPRS